MSIRALLAVFALLVTAPLVALVAWQIYSALQEVALEADVLRDPLVRRLDPLVRDGTNRAVRSTSLPFATA